MSLISLWRRDTKPPFLHESACMRLNFAPHEHFEEVLGITQLYLIPKASQNCSLFRSYPWSFSGRLVSQFETPVSILDSFKPLFSSVIKARRSSNFFCFVDVFRWRSVAAVSHLVMLSCRSLVTLLKFPNSVGSASTGFFIPNPPNRGEEEIVLFHQPDVHQWLMGWILFGCILLERSKEIFNSWNRSLRVNYCNVR